MHCLHVYADEIHNSKNLRESRIMNNTCDEGRTKNSIAEVSALKKSPFAPMERQMESTIFLGLGTTIRIHSLMPTSDQQGKLCQKSPFHAVVPACRVLPRPISSASRLPKSIKIS